MMARPLHKDKMDYSKLAEGINKIKSSYDDVRPKIDKRLRPARLTKEEWSDLDEAQAVCDDQFDALHKGALMIVHGASEHATDVKAKLDAQIDDLLIEKAKLADRVRALEAEIDALTAPVEE